MASHNELGKLGENIGALFLESKGHEIIDRNFWRPYGEIDIVSREKGEKLHFVEVKSVSWETDKVVSYETSYRPEENVHSQKIRRLMRVIEAYLLSKDMDSEWQFDILAVYVDQGAKKAKVRHLENIILGS